ncbi:MAG: hypothetical protein R2827_15045 [Bdellovibrionales bacterium]
MKGCFHQFVFFPWNQDLFGFFDLFTDAYRLKNRLSGLEEMAFMGPASEKDCIARLAFQFYPKGMGFLNKHRDPVNYHQLVVPIFIMSQKGKEFHKGGLYVESKKGERVFLDDVSDVGDVLYFKADLVHGVEKIDPGSNEDWLDFQGRWMGLLAVNKLNFNDSVQDSQDLEA